ncbi:MAG: nickel-responsive transcriptional regulator NikR [Candidatus Thermoplasmatota archaeon]
MNDIYRFGVSIEPELINRFDKIIKKKGYNNRSEAIRDLIRKNIINEDTKDPNKIIIGTLTILYDHHKGKLVEQLLNIQHDNHNEILSTMHIHIDNDNCLEVLILKGEAGKIKKLADNIKALKDVKHGELVITEPKI